MRLCSEMSVPVMLIMNDHNHVNGDYHIMKMIIRIIMLRTMIMTVIGNALECLAAVCLPWLPLSSFPCHHSDILFINVVLLHLCFTLDFASVHCIEAFLQTWMLQPLLPNCVSVASFCIFACRIVADHK